MDHEARSRACPSERFGTHLLEQGVDIYIVSALLGHESLKSTRRYARVTRKIIRQVPSPVDQLPHGRPPKPPDVLGLLSAAAPRGEWLPT